MSSTVLIFLVLYYIVVLGIGYWAMRRGGGDDLEGYLLGGRQVGPVATALTEAKRERARAAVSRRNRPILHFLPQSASKILLLLRLNR